MSRMDPGRGSASSLLGRIRFRLLDLGRGTHVLRKFDELLAERTLDIEALRRIQSDKLARYTRAAIENTDFYSAYERFEDFPYLEKAVVNANADRLMSRIRQGKIFRKKTSGSTGTPMVYFTGEESQNYLWAGILLAWNAAGYRLGDKVAIMAGSALFNSGRKQRAYYAMMNATLLSAFDLHQERLGQYARLLAQGGHRLMYAYASAADRLAEYVIANGLEGRFRLKGIVCTAENLTEPMRARIKKAFGCTVLSQYGCNDAGVSAYECSEGSGFHLIITRCFEELAPDGSLVATDLANQHQFLPRLTTGDVVEMGDAPCRCGCGYPLIRRVIGRTSDILRDREGNSVHAIFIDHMLRENTQIAAYQIVYSDTTLKLNLKLAHGDSVDATRYVAMIRDRLRFDTVQVVFNEEFVRLPNDKYRLLQRVDEIPEVADSPA